MTIDAYTYLGTTDTVQVDVNGSGTTTTIKAAIDAMGDRLASVTNTGAFAWLAPDLHGNVAAQFGKTSGTIVDVFRYDAYGKTGSLNARQQAPAWSRAALARRYPQFMYDE